LGRYGAGQAVGTLSQSKGDEFVRSERKLHERESAEQQRRLADACEKASETIAAAQAASDRANLVLRATDLVLVRVARALERRAGAQRPDPSPP
jgi:hypothetical protein